MHPSDDIRGSKSNLLTGIRIVLAATGSIAVVETIKLARELIRHGAEIIPVMSHSASKIIHPDSLWFATGKKPIIELSGATEHVSYCGRVKDPVDLLLICPCTANTISKIANGIDDTSVTTFATTAIGSNVPILIVPAMHLSMYDHKIIKDNIRKCKTVKIKFIEPNIEKNKAKMPNIDEIVANVIRLTGQKNHFKKRILIIGGPTTEAIDDVRVITNRSSGKTAVLLAKSAFYEGADVELWYGRGYEPVPDWIKKTDYTSLNSLLNLVKNNKLSKFDIIIVCAAVSDYIPKKQEGKISSGKDKLVVEMQPAPKIISILREKAPKAKIIGFKVEEKKDKIKEKSMNLLKNNKLDFVVGNTISGFTNDENEIWIYNQKGKSTNKKGKKEILADYILESIK